jgi:hypothetical protein
MPADSKSSPKTSVANGSAHASRHGSASRGAANPLRLRPWQDLATRVIRDVKSAFSREHLNRTLKTLAWVVALTILIWIYAERAEVVPGVERIIPIAIKTPDPNRAVVTLVDPTELRVTLSGPQAGVEKVQLTGADHRLQMEIDPTPGRHTLDAAALIARQPLLTDNGVSVVKCVPDTVTVNVEPVDEVEVPVRVKEDVAGLVSAVAFEPRQVKLRGPHQMLEAAKAQGLLFVYANLPKPDDLKDMPPHADLARVFVELPPPLQKDAAELHMLTPSVHAIFDIKQAATETMTLDPVPIWPVHYPEFPKRFELVFLNPQDVPMLSSVKVVGPPEQLARIKNGSFRPLAILKLTKEDEPPAPQPRSAKLGSDALRLDLPQDVTLDPNESPRSVEYKIVERSTTE